MFINRKTGDKYHTLLNKQDLFPHRNLNFKDLDHDNIWLDVTDLMNMATVRTHHFALQGKLA